MVSIIERAPAKINLGLDVLGKRDDGYHDLSMVMVSVDLCDYITLSDREDNKIVITSNSPKMPVNDKNDVFKAAQLIKADYGIKKGVSINLDKKIPICAGMGGVEEAKALANKYTEKALADIEQLPKIKAQKQLLEVTKELLKRDI